MNKQRSKWTKYACVEIDTVNFIIYLVKTIIYSHGWVFFLQRNS